MMPNCNLPPDEFSSIREQLAWRWKDISLLYYVGGKTRNRLQSQGIYTCDHPRLLTLLQDGYNAKNVHPIQTKMLPLLFTPVTRVTTINWTTTTKFDNFVYFDIENTLRRDTVEGKGFEDAIVVNVVGMLLKLSSIDGPLTRQRLTKLIPQSSSATIGDYTYVSFTSKDNDCVRQCHEWLRENVPHHTIVHYTSADCVAIPPTTNKLDLHPQVMKQFTTSSELQALHLSNFKLKTIYKQMMKRMGCQNLYDGCEIQNGLQCLYALEKWVTPEGPEGVLENVLKYNRVDCIALLMLHQYLEQTFDIAAKSLMTH